MIEHIIILGVFMSPLIFILIFLWFISLDNGIFFQSKIGLPIASLILFSEIFKVIDDLKDTGDVAVFVAVWLNDISENFFIHPTM